jgi:hypothetical protein
MRPGWRAAAVRWPSVLRRVRRARHRLAFEQAVKAVLGCSALTPGKQPFTLLSMVQAQDVLPYLVALLSFARRLNPQRVVVVCDPTMRAKDLNTLRSMVPHIELRPATDFRHAGLPIGGCWERLAAIAAYARQGYVIQLDADTVTLGPLDEVRAAVEAGTGFVMGERPAQSLTTQAAARDKAAAANWQAPGEHIQGLAEFLMPQAQFSDTLYVRGCAAFAGFPRSPDLLPKLLDFSTRMRSLTGARWDEWGTEQVASNYLLANLAATVVLPFPAYGTPEPALPSSVRLAHFIGSMRFETDQYARVTAQVLQVLVQQ